MPDWLRATFHRSELWHLARAIRDPLIFELAGQGIPSSDICAVLGVNPQHQSRMLRELRLIKNIDRRFQMLIG